MECHTENQELRTKNREPNNREPRAWNREPGTENLEPRTWNPEPRTGNRERRTPNAERHSRRRRAAWRLRQTQEIRQQLVSADGASRQLTPEAETNIQPSPVADTRFDERSELLAWIVPERVGHRDEIDVLRILVAEEVEAALLHPVRPGRRAELVRIV